MTHSLVLKNATIVSDYSTVEGDLAFAGERISQVGGTAVGALEYDVSGCWVLPGMIDDQVHFREPGMEHKATIATESRAAIAGGVTSYMEMPNCVPPTINRERLLAKHERASQTSLANYGFYLGATNDNIEDIKNLNDSLACGIKVFMGASTGNMLVDNPRTLEEIFSHSTVVIATHCEDTPTIIRNEAKVREQYGANPPPELHATIRSDEACFRSSSFAVSLAKKFGARLHVLHLTSALELPLFDTGDIQNKQITCEVCVHHLLFDVRSYDQKGTLVKCNPSVKTQNDRDALRHALITDRIDIIATDHAPHTLAEKKLPFFDAPAGMPLVEFALCAALENAITGDATIHQIVAKTSHNPAFRFDVKERGFIREGYFADVVVIDPNQHTEVNSTPILSKCGWTPFSGMSFSSKVTHTFVNGELLYRNGQFHSDQKGKAIEYIRT